MSNIKIPAILTKLLAIEFGTAGIAHIESQLLFVLAIFRVALRFIYTRRRIVSIFTEYQIR